MTKVKILPKKLDVRSILLLVLLVVAAYSAYSLYVNETYFIESAIKVGDFQISIIGYNYTFVNDTETDYPFYLTITYNLSNPASPNMTVTVFTIGAKVYNQYNKYIGSNGVYLRHKLTAGSSMVYTLGVPLTKNITLAVVFTKVTLIIDTKIHVLRLSSAYDLSALPTYTSMQ